MMCVCMTIPERLYPNIKSIDLTSHHIARIRKTQYSFIYGIVSLGCLVAHRTVSLIYTILNIGM